MDHGPQPFDTLDFLDQDHPQSIRKFGVQGLGPLRV